MSVREARIAKSSKKSPRRAQAFFMVIFTEKASTAADFSLRCSVNIQVSLIFTLRSSYTELLR